jgi:hypothetical protein
MYLCCVQSTHKIRRVWCQRFAIGYKQDHDRQDKGDHQFRGECHGVAIHAGHGYGEPNRVVLRRPRSTYLAIATIATPLMAPENCAAV